MKCYLSTLLVLAFTFVMGYGQQAPLGIVLSAEETANEDQVELTLQINDFTDINALQLFLFWDETILRIEESSFTAPSLSGLFVVLPEQDMLNPEKGKCKINWFDGLGLGVSVPNETILCKLLFNKVGPECSTTEFFFQNLSDDPMLPALMLLASNESDVDVGIASEPIEYQIPGPDCSTSVEENPSESIASVRIYPNPVRDNLQVSFNNHHPVSSALMIYDEEGRLLSENNLNSTETNVDISSITNGIYFYEIQDKGIVVDKGKIMKI